MNLLNGTDNVAGVFLSCIDESQKLEEKALTRIIPVLSPKERMGKSILISNVAVELAKMGRRVIILNLTRGLRDVYYMLDVKPIDEKTQLNEIEVLEAPHGVKLLSQNLGINSLTSLSNEKRDRLIDELARIIKAADIMLVDTPMSVNSNLSMIMKISKEVIVLTNPALNVMMDSYRLIKAVSSLNGEISIKLVINKTHSAREAKLVFKKISAVTRRFLNRPIINYSFLLHDVLVNESIFRRTPFVISEPRSHPAGCIRSIARLLGNESAKLSSLKSN